MFTPRRLEGIGGRSHGISEVSRVFVRPPLLSGLVLVAAMLRIGSLSAGELAGKRVETYDIPAQTLNAALTAYIRASGAQVFYATPLTDGKRSQSVTGPFTSEAALQTLLAGSGLVMERTDIDAYILKEPSANDTTLAPIVPDIHFLGALQNGVLRALCRNPLIRPGPYGVRLAVWIVPQGVIQKTTPVGSTGNAARDVLLGSALKGQSIGVSPPTDVPQPFILTISPRAPRDTGDCDG